MSLSNITRSQKVIKLVNEFLKAKVVSNLTQNVCLHPYDVNGNLEKDFVLLKLFDKPMFINHYYVHGIVFELDSNKNDLKLKLWQTANNKINRNKLFIKRSDIHAFDKEFDVSYYLIDALLSKRHFKTNATTPIVYYTNGYDYDIANQSGANHINLGFIEKAIMFVECNCDGNLRFDDDCSFGVILFSDDITLCFYDLDDFYVKTENKASKDAQSLQDSLTFQQIVKVVRQLDENNNFDNPEISKIFVDIV